MTVVMEVVMLWNAVCGSSFCQSSHHGVNKTSGGVTNGMRMNESYHCSHNGGDGGVVMLWNAASASSPPYYHSSQYDVNETSG